MNRSPADALLGATCFKLDVSTRDGLLVRSYLYDAESPLDRHLAWNWADDAVAGGLSVRITEPVDITGEDIPLGIITAHRCPACGDDVPLGQVHACRRSA